MKLWVGLARALVAGAQNREIGANIGYGIYRNGTIYSAGVSAQAGMRNRFAAGIIWDTISPAMLGVSSAISITTAILFCRLPK